MPKTAFNITVTTDAEIAHFLCRSDELITEAGERAGIRLFSCASGYCGACKARLIDGKIDNHLNDQGADVLLCKAYPGSDLTLKTLFAWHVTKVVKKV